MNEKDHARMIFKRIKARLTTFEELSDDDLRILLRHYPFIVTNAGCEFEEELPCGNPATAIISAEKDNERKRIAVCKKHMVKLILRLLYNGYKVSLLR